LKNIFTEKEYTKLLYLALTLKSHIMVRCNICSQDIDEKEVDSHINTPQHKENKERLGKIKTTGSNTSVVKVWQDSFNKG